MKPRKGRTGCSTESCVIVIDVTDDCSTGVSTTIYRDPDTGKELNRVSERLPELSRKESSQKSKSKRRGKSA
jgi:hypothetical protein